MAKEKAHKPYEFGVKTDLATTAWGGFALGAMSLLVNPHDGCTLEEQSEQVESLSDIIPKWCRVNLVQRRDPAQDLDSPAGWQRPFPRRWRGGGPDVRSHVPGAKELVDNLGLDRFKKAWFTIKIDAMPRNEPGTVEHPG